MNYEQAVLVALGRATLSTKQVAERAGISTGAARRWLHKLRKKGFVEMDPFRHNALGGALWRRLPKSRWPRGA